MHQHRFSLHVAARGAGLATASQVGFSEEFLVGLPGSGATLQPLVTLHVAKEGVVGGVEERMEREGSVGGKEGEGKAGKWRGRKVLKR